MAEGIEVRQGKRGKTYRAVVWSGTDRKFIKRSFPTMAAAKSWRRDTLRELEDGSLVMPSAVTVQEAADQFLEDARAGVARTGRKGHRGHVYKPATIRSYEKALRLRILPTLGSMKLQEVRRKHVQALVDKLIRDGFAGSSINNTLDPLRVVFRRARSREMISHDPCSDLELPADESKRDRIASLEESERLLAALPEDERTLWATALYAGLRRGELRALTVDDIDLGKSEIRVERTWDDVEGPVSPKSSAGRRIVPLQGLLRDYLDEHLIKSGRSGADLVFGRSATEPFTNSTVRNRAISAWEKAGLDPIGLHECRHTFASVLIAAGANSKAIQEALGHASIQMTFDRYGHLMPGGRKEMRDLLDGFVSDRLADRESVTA